MYMVIYITYMTSVYFDVYHIYNICIWWYISHTWHVYMAMYITYITYVYVDIYHINDICIRRCMSHI